MSSYLIQSETLTGLGDKIRTLSETTGTKTPAEMTTLVDTANGVIDTTQAGIISQIQTALINKTAGKTPEEKTVTPTGSVQEITPTDSNHSLSKVTVNGDNNLIASNIKKNITIFGVIGSYEGISVTEPYIEETYDSNDDLIGVILHGYTKVRNSMFSS